MQRVTEPCNFTKNKKQFMLRFHLAHRPLPVLLIIAAYYHGIIKIEIALNKGRSFSRTRGGEG